MTLICIWLLYDWWFSFRNDILSIFLKWYFEITFFPLKMDCADRPSEITYFSISCQHNLLKDFLWFPFRNNIWLSFRNEQCVPIFILKCFMTVILKWGGKIFVHKIIFVNKISGFFLTKTILCTKILPCSFANESHISFQNVKHRKLLSEIVLTWYRKVSNLEMTVSTILFYRKWKWFRNILSKL